MHVCAPVSVGQRPAAAIVPQDLPCFFVTKSLTGTWGLPIMLDCMESSDLLVITFTFVLGSNSGSHVYAAAFYQLSHLMVSQLYLWKDDCFNHKHTSLYAHGFSLLQHSRTTAEENSLTAQVKCQYIGFISSTTISILQAEQPHTKRPLVSAPWQKAQNFTNSYDQ